MSEENKNELTIEEEEVSVSDSSNDSNIVDDLPLVTIDNENDNVSSASDIQLDYLNPKLFEDIRTVDINDLISSADESSVKDEVKEQYLGSISDISENQVLSGRVIGMNEKEILLLSKIIMDSCINNIINTNNNIINIEDDKYWFTEKILSCNKSKKD